jgi:hypothetical protein
MHHGSEKDEKLSEIMAQLTTEKGELGATGEFPGGKLAPTDEGEIAFAVGSHEGKVILEFGTPVVWLGMSPKQARELADSLRRRAMQITRSLRRERRRPRRQPKRSKRG